MSGALADDGEAPVVMRGRCWSRPRSDRCVHAGALHAIERFRHERRAHAAIHGDFTTSRSVMMLSAMQSLGIAEIDLVLLGESSWNEYSTGMPIASLIVVLRRSLDTSAVVRSKYEA